MKKILTLLLATTLLLASCGGNPDETLESSTTDTTQNDTLGDGNDDGVIEGENNTDSIPENDETASEDFVDDSVEGDTTAEAVTSVTSAEDAVTFIDVNVYSQCMDVLPMSTMSTILSLEDMDSVTFITGLTDLTGVNDIIVSESMIGSFAYSFVMVRTDGTNTDDIQTALGEQINPQKWVCVWADQIRSVRLDNDIILVMSDSDRADPVMNAVLNAAEGVYENIGTVINVLG